MATEGCSDNISPGFKPNGIGIKCAAALGDDYGQPVMNANDQKPVLTGWQEPAEAAGKACKITLRVAFFFDGTGNNRDADEPSLKNSNVARLFRAQRRSSHGKEKFMSHVERMRRTAAKARGALMALMLLCVLLVSACQAQERGDKPPKNGQEVMLTLIAYNYTDNYIDSYSVDGAGGGNVFVSSPTTGGSKSGCCVRWMVGRPLPVKVHIRWESGACIYTKRVEGEDFDEAKQFFSEKDVWLTQLPSANPQFFETHFYPDGHIEVAITDDYTLPRLKLPRTVNGARPNTRPQPRCTAEQLSQGDD